MVVDGFLILAGLILLTAGGEALLRGAVGVALHARITPAVVGLTIVAAGTSMPELVVSVQAALAGSPGVSIGNVVGSNVFNVAAILGLAALVHPMRVEGNTVRLEWPVMTLAAFQLVLLSRDGTVDRLEGGFLLTALVVFLAYAVRLARRDLKPAEQRQFQEVVEPSRSLARTWGVPIGLVAVGMGLLAGGSTLLVRGAVAIAEDFGVSDTIIGLTIVAAGTSLPEMVTSVVAAVRGRDDIAVANVIGSNIFNVLGIVSVTALVRPLPVASEVIERDNWWMLAFSLLLFPLMRTGMRVSRAEGAVLLGCFATYMAVLIRAA